MVCLVIALQLQDVKPKLHCVRLAKAHHAVTLYHDLKGRFYWLHLYYRLPFLGAPGSARDTNQQGCH